MQLAESVFNEIARCGEEEEGSNVAGEDEREEEETQSPPYSPPRYATASVKCIVLTHSRGNSRVRKRTSSASGSRKRRASVAIRHAMTHAGRMSIHCNISNGCNYSETGCLH